MCEEVYEPVPFGMHVVGAIMLTVLVTMLSVLLSFLLQSSDNVTGITTIASIIGVPVLYTICVILSGNDKENKRTP